MSARIRRLSSSLVILVAGLVLLTSPLLAAGKLDFVAKFKQGSLELNVATYTEQNSTTGKLDKVGLLALAAGTLRNSFASDGPQWPQLIALVAKAAKAQSAGNKWTVVGAISETGHQRRLSSRRQRRPGHKICAQFSERSEPHL